MISLGLDIGSNSVGSAWVARQAGHLVTGTSVFPAGVEESDEKRGDPTNLKRRMTRHTRINLARRADRKRQLRLKLISLGLLPSDAAEFRKLLEETDPWVLRQRGLSERLCPYHFGRVLLHLAQRRGALGLKMDESDEEDSDSDDGKVKAAIKEINKKMNERNAETFGAYIAMLRAERVTPITTEDERPANSRVGPREFRAAIRNKPGVYEHCADRAMIRDEFARLWDSQKRIGGPLADKLTDELRRELDHESRKGIWRHEGLLFGQRKTYWDTGTLGRCDLEPTERCIPHADMYASRYLVVETVNNLKIIERGKEPRPLTPDERDKIMLFLSGPLGIIKKGKYKGQSKRTVSITDLRELMESGRAGKTAPFRFNIESDEDRIINTDWFSREIIHGAITIEKWRSLTESGQEGLNRAILKFDPDDVDHGKSLKSLVTKDWAGLTEAQTGALVAAWTKRPRPDAKRLNMSRRAARNLLVLMDRPEPWPDATRHGQTRWLTQIEARKLIALDADFIDVTTGKPLSDRTRRRYATGAKGATARDRHFMRKHLLKKSGKEVFDPDGLPLYEPPPVPVISNPVVRKAIHEVRRHLIEYMTIFARKPDEVYIELSREAKMGKKDSDELLARNRLRSRIRSDIITAFELDSRSSTQQRAAVDRVILCVQQGGVCPLCGKPGLTPRIAANGEGCQVAHIIPKASGGHNGLGNIVLAHTKCNQDMGRRTPREFWDSTLEDGFEEGMRWIEGIYAQVQRPRPSEVKNAQGDSLWSSYFTGRPRRRGPTFDELKIEQFKKHIKDIQQMTNRQDAATKYAARQVMAYLADALYDGNGLPERGGERKIFATDGMWTSRLRREWGLCFDPHQFKAKGLSGEDEHQRKEKNRGDHRHHAIDAVVVALSTHKMQSAWDEREKQADRDGLNTADEEAMDNYRRQHPLPPPAPFRSREEFREAVRRAVFGEGEIARPICHRPVKRKLIGHLHKARLYGPVVDIWNQGGIEHRELVEGRVTVRQDILGEAPTDFLKPMQLRLPRPETDEEAVDRLARRFRIGTQELTEEEAIKSARKLVRSKAFTRADVSPKPEKGGIVRDVSLRRLLRLRLQERHLNPDSYTKSDLKKSIDKHGPLTMGPLINDKGTGTPIYRVVLLWSNNDPVTIRRDEFDYLTGERQKLDDPATLRLYDSQNNHHIEIRAKKQKNGSEVFFGDVVTTFEVSRRLMARLGKLKPLERPFRHLRKKLTKEHKQGRSNEAIVELSQRRITQWKEALRNLKPQRREIMDANPLIDRSDNEQGSFVMSLSEGETLFMRRKGNNGEPGELGYFVVAKLDKPQGIVLVAHWDARAATERKDAEGKKVPDSNRDDFTVTPTDLKKLAPLGQPHAVKVRVSPLGVVTELHRD